jgi:hypothetical protein
MTDTMRASATMAVVLAVLAASQTGCSVAAPGASSGVPAARALPTPLTEPPEWKRGDRWNFSWTSGTDRGTKTLEIVEVRDLNQVLYYVVRLGDTDHLYTRELHWAAVVRESRVEARMVPAQPWYLWPLEVGQTWAHQGTFEERNGKTRFSDRFRVVAVESVEVPAGRFETLKILRETDGRDFDEYWYAPAARWHVLWKGRRGDTTFEERLQSYDPAPRRIPSVGSDGRTR